MRTTPIFAQTHTSERTTSPTGLFHFYPPGVATWQFCVFCYLLKIRHSTKISSAPFRLISIHLTWTKLLLTDVLNASWRNAWCNTDPNPNPHPNPNPNPNSDPNHNHNPDPNLNPNSNPRIRQNGIRQIGIRRNGIRRNGKTPENRKTVTHQ